MNAYEMGRVSAFLLRYRRVEEKSERRQISREEKDIAAILREAPLEAASFLQELLLGEGYHLISLTSFDVSGIPQGARVHLLVRRSNSDTLLHGAERLVEVMDPGRTTAAKIWFTQLWLLHLDLLYTRRDRGPAERNRWLEATFKKDELLGATRDHVNNFVRRLNPTDVEGSEVYRMLVAEKGAVVERYVTRFLSLMVEGGMLDDMGDGVFRQSLLAAVEMKVNFDDVLAPLMVQVHGATAPLAAAAHPLMVVSAPAAEDVQ